MALVLLALSINLLGIGAGCAQSEAEVIEWPKAWRPGGDLVASLDVVRGRVLVRSPEATCRNGTHGRFRRIAQRNSNIQCQITKTEPVLSVRDSTSPVSTRAACVLKAIDGVLVRHRQGEVLGVVGESGAGQVRDGRGGDRAGSIRPGRTSAARSLLSASESDNCPRKRCRKVRGLTASACIFQDPLTSLNSRLYKISEQLVETSRPNRPVPGSSARQRAIDLPGPRSPSRRRRSASTPTRTTSLRGMRQGVVIALRACCAESPS